MGFNLAAIGTAINLLAALGILSYAFFLHRRRDRSLTERRLFFAVLLQGLFFLAQAGTSWHPGAGYQWLELATRCCIPLSLGLVVEAARRQHLPLALKIWLALPVVLLPPLYAWLEPKTLWLGVYAVILGVGVVALLVLIRNRNRSEVSEAENRFLDMTTFAGAVMIPLSLTDLPELLPLSLPLRLGGVGALIFVYICLHSSVYVELISRAVAELLRMLGLAVVCSLGLFYLTGLGASGDAGPVAVATLALAFTMLLTNAVLSLLQEHRRVRSDSSFNDWLRQADSSSLANFLAAFTTYPLTANVVYLQGPDLAAYDATKLAATLAKDGGRLSLGRIRREKRHCAPDSLHAYEQLEHLLVKHRTNVAYLLSTDKPSVLLFSVSSLGDGGHRQRELQTVVKLAATLETQGVLIPRAVDRGKLYQHSAQAMLYGQEPEAGGSLGDGTALSSAEPYSGKIPG